MKNSEIYKKAAMAVMNDASFTFDDRWEILKQLAEDERMAKYTEKREEEAAV